jgi:hypothetical protein
MNTTEHKSDVETSSSDEEEKKVGQPAINWWSHCTEGNAGKAICRYCGMELSTNYKGTKSKVSRVWLHFNVDSLGNPDLAPVSKRRKICGSNPFGFGCPAVSKKQVKMTECFTPKIIPPGLQKESTSSNSPPFSVPLDDIIGATSHLTCVVHDIFVKGLTVKCWKYTSPKFTSFKPTVIGIHGGPAFTHRYMLPLKLLADDGFPVILYDQGFAIVLLICCFSLIFF